MTERVMKTFGRVRSIDEESRQVEVAVSTERIARDGAVIMQGGWDLSHYTQNPVVLWAHDDRSLPVAKTISSRVQDGVLLQTHEFASHPRAQEVFEAVRDGFVNATSVRWLPGQYEWRKVDGQDILYFTNGHQLLESSYVPIPADPHALVLRENGEPLDRAAFPDPNQPQVNEDEDILSAINQIKEKLSE